VLQTVAENAKLPEGTTELLGKLKNFIAEETMAYTWGWHPQGSGVRLEFNENGSVWHLGMHGKWAVVAERRVMISPADGHPKVLMEFDEDLSKWSEVDGDLGGIRREGRTQKK
jgi:hypothetical protein